MIQISWPALVDPGRAVGGAGLDYSRRSPMNPATGDVTMLNMTDAELRDLGWKWALRDDQAGTLIAVTTSPMDCAEWIRENRGVVVSLTGWWARTVVEPADADRP